MLSSKVSAAWPEDASGGGEAMASQHEPLDARTVSMVLHRSRPQDASSCTT